MHAWDDYVSFPVLLLVLAQCPRVGMDKAGPDGRIKKNSDEKWIFDEHKNRRKKRRNVVRGKNK